MSRNLNRTVSVLYLFIIALLCFSVPVKAQKEGNIWYFGSFAGLDFNSGSPVELLDGKLTTSEGCATIADENGRLRFYTDGITVWDRTHKPMANGTGLLGHPSATQSGIIVPHPGDTNLFYVFTVTQVAMTDGMCYSVVDLRRNGGLGDVVQKNIKLFTPSTEKITAVRHANDRDFWVIAHEWGSNKFRAYLINTSGFQATPVISSCGASHTGAVSGSAGQMTAATDGSRLALVGYTINVVEAFDFDNSTGKVSNPISFPALANDYSISFSPDNSKLYVGNYFNPPVIYQYDLKAGSVAQILGSQYEVCRLSPGTIGALQIAPDGKIYIARGGNPFLSAIENPNEAGAACAYNDKAVTLTRPSSIGLPAIIQSFFKPSVISFKFVCEGKQTAFSVTNAGKDDTLTWDFGDPGSGADNTSLLLNPLHRFTKAGKYTVKLVIQRKGKSQTYTANVEIFKNPTVVLPADTEFCASKPLVLDVSGLALASYLWSDGSTNAQFTVPKPGKYWVQGTNSGGCRSADTIVILPRAQDVRSLGKDTALCPGISYTIQPDKPVNSIRWSDGSTGPSLTVNKSGIYWADLTLECGTIRDSIRVDYFQVPPFSLGGDTLVCEGAIFRLQGAPSAKAFRWNDGSQDTGLMVKKPGIYWVDMTFECTTVRDSIRVDYKAAPKVELGRDTLICAGDKFLLRVSAYGASYKWQDGSTDSVYTVTNSGTYRVTVTNFCGQATDSIHVSFFNPPRADLGRDTLLCLGDSLVWDLKQPFATYRWQDSSTSSRYVVRKPGHYSVEVSNACRTEKGGVTVDFEDCTCYLYAPNSFSPNDDGENDSFYISFCKNRDFLLQIYNRWGERVFESTDIRQGWDGRFKGVVVPEGVYIYTVQVRGMDKSWKTAKGQITVVR